MFVCWALLDNVDRLLLSKESLQRTMIIQELHRENLKVGLNINMQEIDMIINEGMNQMTV